MNSKKWSLCFLSVLLVLAMLFLPAGSLGVSAGSTGSPQTAAAQEDNTAEGTEETEEKTPSQTTPFGIVHRIQFEAAGKFCAEQLRKARPQREPEPVHPMDKQFRELSSYLEETMEAWNGSEKWAVTVTLEDGKLSGTFGYEEPMTAASLIKLYVAGACMEEQGKEENGLSEHVLTRMDAMLFRSDNEACNALISQLSMDKINAFIEEKGFSDTLLRRRMLEARTQNNENMTSVRDCSRVLYEILHGEYVSEEASERILNDLKDQERRWKIPAGLPEGIESANKTGELDNVENDAAIVWGEKTTYIVCIMSENVPPGRAQERIRELSAEIYRILNQ